MANLKLFNQENKTELGFTFIELILYIALVSIFLTGAVYFALDIIYGQVRANAEQEVSENIRIAGQRIQVEIRNAKDILSVTPTSLELDSGSLGITKIALVGDTIKITQGGVTSNLISSKVEATELLFSNLTSQDKSSKNIGLSLTIKHRNPFQRKEWEERQTLKTSVELRSN